MRFKPHKNTANILIYRWQTRHCLRGWEGNKDAY